MRALVLLMATVAVWWAGYSAAEFARLLWLSGYSALPSASDWRPEAAGCAVGTALAVLVWCTLRGWTMTPSVSVPRRLRPAGGSRVAQEQRPRRLRPYSPALTRDIALLHPVGSAGNGR
jgi:hypothetical protein